MKAVSLTEANTDLHRLTVRGGRCAIAEAIGGSEDGAKAKIDKRNRQLDANTAATGADWAEADAADALDFAAWTVENAQLSILDAIDARAYADERATAARS